MDKKPNLEEMMISVTSAQEQIKALEDARDNLYRQKYGAIDKESLLILRHELVEIKNQHEYRINEINRKIEIIKELERNQKVADLLDE